MLETFGNRPTAFPPPELPDWESACRALDDQCRATPGEHAFVLEFLEPGKRPVKKVLLSLFCRATRLLGEDSDIRKLCGRWTDLHRFVLEQVLRNRDLPASPDRGDLFYRGHHQLPCTRETRERRAHEVERVLRKSDPILIIGDDDLQGIELARRGFTDITVIEIDPRLVDHIRRISESEGLGIRLVPEAVQNVPIAWARPYRAVLMDPPCNIRGLRVFLDGAFRLGVPGHEQFLFLHTHLLSYLREGYEELREMFHRNGYELVASRPAFNHYPIPRGPALILNLLLRFADPRIRSAPLRYFVSDFLLFRISQPEIRSRRGPSTS